METANEKAREAILLHIAKLAPEVRAGTPRDAQVVLNLAEAYAWLSSENQPHGGQTTISTSS